MGRWCTRRPEGSGPPFTGLSTAFEGGSGSWPSGSRRSGLRTGRRSNPPRPPFFIGQANIAKSGDVRINLRSHTAIRGRDPSDAFSRGIPAPRIPSGAPRRRGDRRRIAAVSLGYRGRYPRRTVDVHVAGFRKKIESDPRTGLLCLQRGSHCPLSRKTERSRLRVRIPCAPRTNSQLLLAHKLISSGARLDHCLSSPGEKLPRCPESTREKLIEAARRRLRVRPEAVNCSE
jgi:hypothetical protein